VQALRDNKTIEIFRSTLRQTVFLPAFLGAAIAIIFLWQINEMRYSMERIDHSDRVISHANYLQKLFVDAETGVRGFDINREEIFLEPYDKSIKTIHQRIEMLRRLVSDNPDQIARLNNIEKTGDEWLEMARSAIANSKKIGAAVSPGALNHHGKALMDNIRNEIDGLITADQTLKRTRIEKAQDTSNIAISIGIGLGIVLFSLLLFWARRMLRRLSRQYETVLDDSIRSREWFQTTLTSIGDAVIVVDKEAKIEFLNPIAETLTGWSRQEANGRPMSEVFRIINEKTRVAAFNPVERVLNEGIIVGLANHTVLISKNGKEYPIEDSAAPVRKGDGKVFGVVLVFRDVTERHRTDAILHEAIQSRDEFLSIASHELKTPLTTLKLQLQIHLRNTESGSAAVSSVEKTKKLVETCFDQTLRLESLVDSLLDVTRIQQGKLEFSFERANLVEVISKTIDQLKPQLEAAKCVVSFQSASEIWAHFDKFRIEQVVINLLSNSMKYGPGKPIKITAEITDENAVITVTDQGIGIHKDKHEIIFERFERAIDATNVSGLGLGLHIVSQIVEGHAGKVKVHSEINKGASFTVLLPLNPKHVTQIVKEKKA
jgi:PAS domain S-box-containing protein